MKALRVVICISILAVSAEDKVPNLCLGGFDASQFALLSEIEAEPWRHQFGRYAP
jgi:hypothetical protein